MTAASPILPALGGFDMSSHPTGLNDTQDSTKVILVPSSPAAAKASLPPFSSLAVTAQEHNPSSRPGSPISPSSASSGDNSRDSSNTSMEANSSFNSDEGVGEAMDTREQPSSPSPTADSMRGIPPPTWTNRWTSRAPPPKPLVRSSLGGRRHHPYAPSSSSSRGGATPSPTWPAHIGIEDGTAKHGMPGGSHAVEGHPPHTAGFFDAVPSPQFRQPTRPARLRSTTVILPPPHGDLAHDGQHPQRPGGPSRHNSFGGAQDADRPNSMASSSYLLGHRRSRGDSFATTDSSHSYPSTHPSSPLLFAPLSPNEPFAPPYGVPPSHHQKGPAGYMPRFAYGPPGAQSPHVGSERVHMGYEESPKGGPLYLSPYDRYDHARRMQAPQLPSPATAGPVSQHGKVDQWRGVVVPPSAGGDAQAASTPALERVSHSRRRRRPPYSYSSLIAQAITSSPQGRMTLREIYTWISNAYPELYSMDGADSQGWQNTVRHNLSLNKSFVKVARTAQDIYEGCSSNNPAHSQAARGKGGWWTIDPVVAQAQLGTNFRGTGGETSPTEAHGRARYRESSPEGYSDGEYFPSPANTPGYGIDPSWPRAVPGPASNAAEQQRRGSADGAAAGAGSVASGVPAYPANYPSVLMRPRPRPSSLDQSAMLGYDQRPPSFGRNRGYSNSELLPQRGVNVGSGAPVRAHYGIASTSSTVPRPPQPQHTLAPIGQPDKGHGRLLEVPTRDTEMSDRDPTPKAGDHDGETETPQAGEGERSGRMAISDMLC